MNRFARRLAFLTEWQAQGAQTLLERSSGIVAHRANSTFTQIHDCERLQNIIQLTGREIDGEVLVPVHPCRVLEIANAVSCKEPLVLPGDEQNWKNRMEGGRVEISRLERMSLAFVERLRCKDPRAERT